MPGIAVLGAQWGDEGKGKIAHLICQDADMSVRFNGGTNAGHTVVFTRKTTSPTGGPGSYAKSEEGEFKFHLIPSGALHPQCVGVLGNGMVIEPFSLAEELVQLKHTLEGEPRVYISQNAHLILPYHPILERLEGSTSELDTTAKGIGPAYQDKVARRGIRAVDLLDPKRFHEKLRRNLERLQMLHPDSKPLSELHVDSLAERSLSAAEHFQKAIVDTTLLIHQALTAGQRVVFEGAQGCLLDIDFGTYPYVTSSHSTIGGVGIGAGISPRRMERVIGVVKAFSSRVGVGPFPTEERGPMGERLRGTGANPWDEFGTTTGRPRRCGWLDLVALKYSARINGFTDLALVKLDVLSDLPAVRVAVAYRHGGKRLDEYPLDTEVLSECEPVYEELASWSEELGGCREWDDLPRNAQRYVRFLEEALHVPVSLISVGRAFEQTIWRDEVRR
jgi:adenylosuccinate synthase